MRKCVNCCVCSLPMQCDASRVMNSSPHRSGRSRSVTRVKFCLKVVLLAADRFPLAELFEAALTCGRDAYRDANAARFEAAALPESTCFSNSPTCRSEIYKYKQTAEAGARSGGVILLSGHAGSSWEFQTQVSLHTLTSGEHPRWHWVGHFLSPPGLSFFSLPKESSSLSSLFPPGTSCLLHVSTFLSPSHLQLHELLVSDMFVSRQSILYYKRNFFYRS